MNRTLIIVLGIIALLILLFYTKYNSLVTKNEDTRAKWALVQSQYQRRLDLFNNVVNTIKASANFEKSTLEAVVDARSKATSVQVDPSKLTPESIQKYEQAQNSSFSRMLLVVERYPDLKTTEAFKDFQNFQIEGTENRINKARDDFNLSVQDYNTSIKRFPTNIIAGMFGFTEKGYFQAAAGTDKAPDTFKEEDNKPVGQ